MKKTIFVFAMIVLTAGASVQAQKKPTQPIGSPLPFSQTISVEDDATGNYLVFFTGTGKYKFTRCSDGFTITGVGFVKVDGCTINLEDVQSDHRVVASVNECDQQAKALVERFSPEIVSSNQPASILPFDVEPFKAILSDVNVSNNLLDCAPRM